MIQAQVLNKIIQSKDASIITLNNLSVDSFSEYKDEFCFIRNHLTKYGNIPDIVDFYSYVRGWNDCIDEILGE